MAEFKIFVDRDLVRAGFDLESIRFDDVEVAESERLSAVATFVIVVSYIGGRALDKITDGALSKPLDKVLEFTRSRSHRLRLEIENRALDPRIHVVVARLEGIERSEFDRALASIKFIESKAKTILSITDEYIKELYFVWQDDDWLFTYYITEGGEVVQEQPHSAQ